MKFNIWNRIANLSEGDKVTSFVGFGCWAYGIAGLVSDHGKNSANTGKWAWLWNFIDETFGPNGQSYVLLTLGTFLIASASALSNKK